MCALRPAVRSVVRAVLEMRGTAMNKDLWFWLAVFVTAFVLGCWLAGGVAA